MKASSNCNRLGDFQVDIENLFDHFFGNVSPASGQTSWTPSTNVTESETGYKVVMELPGVIADDVSIEIKDNTLDVHGNKTVTEPAEGERRARSERRSGDFRRKFEFSTSVNADGISAEFKHGLLTIELPKSEKVLPRKINIKSSDG